MKSSNSWFLALFLLAFNACPLIAEQPSPLASKLVGLKGTLDGKQREFSESTSRISEIERELKSQLGELTSIRSQIGEIESVYKNSVKETSQAQKRTSQARELLSSSAERFNARFVSMYRQAKISQQLMIVPTSGKVAYKDILFSKRIASADLGLLKKLVVEKRELESQEKLLSDLLATQEKLKIAFAERLKQQKVIVALRKQLLSEEKARRTTIKKVIASLQQKAKELEELIESETRGDQGPVDGGDKGLGPLQGLQPPLLLPVEGKMVQNYGKKKVRGLQDFIFSKGIEFATASRSSVRTVGAGIIRFVGEMPGYGLTILVDHGNRYFSLYGRLAETLVVQGEGIAPGATIARTSDLDDEGRNFYFEIRERGVALNPRRFIR